MREFSLVHRKNAAVSTLYHERLGPSPLQVHELQLELLRNQTESIGDRSGGSTSAKHDVTSPPDQEGTCSLDSCAKQRRALLEDSADLAKRNQELSRNLMSALDQLTRSSEQMLLVREVSRAPVWHVGL